MVNIFNLTISKLFIYINIIYAGKAFEKDLISGTQSSGVCVAYEYDDAK